MTAPPFVGAIDAAGFCSSPRTLGVAKALLLTAFLTGLPQDNAHAQCYSLFDGNNKLVYQSTEPLVDLSKPISDQIALAYPGHHLVIAPLSLCPEIDERASTLAAAKRIDGTRGSIYDSPRFRLADETGYADSSSDASMGHSNRRPAGKDVRVKSYQRASGANVSGHTRAAPGRGK